MVTLKQVEMFLFGDSDLLVAVGPDVNGNMVWVHVNPVWAALPIGIFLVLFSVYLSFYLYPLFRKRKHAIASSPSAEEKERVLHDRMRNALMTFRPADHDAKNRSDRAAAPTVSRKAEEKSLRIWRWRQQTAGVPLPELCLPTKTSSITANACSGDMHSPTSPPPVYVSPSATSIDGRLSPPSSHAAELNTHLPCASSPSGSSSESSSSASSSSTPSSSALKTAFTQPPAPVLVRSPSRSPSSPMVSLPALATVGTDRPTGRDDSSHSFRTLLRVSLAAERVLQDLEAQPHATDARGRCADAPTSTGSF